MVPAQRAPKDAAAVELNRLREGWLNPPGADAATLKTRTVTNLSNQRPTWLAHAHAALDAAVFEAYGWPADLSDEEILARLLRLNLEREPAWHGSSTGLLVAAATVCRTPVA